MRIRSGPRAGFVAGEERAPPLKHLSQNFLVDAGVAARIVAALSPGPEDHVVEIGPGRGALAAALAERAGRLVAIELDRRLAERLSRKLEGRSGVRVIQADVLTVPLASLREGPRLRLVGNLPYGISSPVVLKVLDEADDLQDAVFMFQQEFAHRLAAAHGTREYGSLSALVQTRLRVEHLFDVGPAAFEPQPSVRSTVVRLTPLEVPLVRPDRRETLKLLLRFAFSGRRKTLANALARGLGTSREEAAALLVAALLEPSARAETVPPLGWARLAELPELPAPRDTSGLPRI